MRGFWEGRYRGKSSLLGNAEFRYHIMHLKLKNPKLKFVNFIIDGNVFADAGQVFISEKIMDPYLRLDYQYSYGFGFRLTTPPNLMGRLDVGFSGEQQFASYFNFGTVF